MYKSFDGKSFVTEEELQSHEHTVLKRTKLKLSLINVYGHYVESQMALDRVCQMELDGGFQTIISDAITFPSFVVSFSDDEVMEFHVVSLNEAASSICEHVSKVFR
jgi:hypothetical protein